MDHREQVEAIKASWLEDPCWDLEEMDFENAEYAHLKPYADEFTAFARETKARWKAEREAEYSAAIDKIEERVIGRLSVAGRLGLAHPLLAPALLELTRAFAEEIQNLWVLIHGNAEATAAAHGRLDKIGAPRAEG